MVYSVDKAGSFFWLAFDCTAGSKKNTKENVFICSINLLASNAQYKRGLIHTVVGFMTGSHNVVLPSSGKTEALKQDGRGKKRHFTWTVVHQHDPRLVASTTRPLLPVEGMNHVVKQCNIVTAEDQTVSKYF